MERDAGELKSLILKCCQAQTGENPPFNPNELFEQYEEIDKLITEITIKIQRTNNEIKFAYDDNKSNEEPLRSMTQAIADIDDLERQINVTDDIIHNGIIKNCIRPRRLLMCHMLTWLHMTRQERK